MARILDQITGAYPALATRLLSLPADEVSDTRLMAELACHVVDLLETAKPENVDPAFKLAENLLSVGSDEERDAAVLGFLETVQNVASHRECGAEAFHQFLGPASLSAWAHLKNVWRGKATLAEVVAAETGAAIRPRWWQFWKKRSRPRPADLLAQVQDPELRRIIEQITRE
jgi:hypothetical protein